MEQGELAGRLNVSKQWLSGVKLGRWNGDEKLRQAAGILGVPEEWLLSGTGPAPAWAALPPPAPVVESAPAWAVELLAEVRALRIEVRALNPDRPPRRRPPAPSEVISKPEAAELIQTLAAHGFDVPPNPLDELFRFPPPEPSPPNTTP